MKGILTIYNEMKQKVEFLVKSFPSLFKRETNKGRKLALSIVDIITLSLIKQKQGIETKKSLYEIVAPKCSYKTLVVNMNRFSIFALFFLKIILSWNAKNSHMVKHTDSTDIPVCLNKNATHHKTMEGLARWGHSGKGMFYGIKLHLTADLERNMLSFCFACGNASDISQFMRVNKDLYGIFVADAGYTSQKLQKEFYREHRRILFAKPRKNMKKLITAFQKRLYDTRMIIELNFRNLKMFYGLITSLPRSVSGYFANYLYAILAYALK